MIAYILGELEKNPTSIFYKQDLLKRSKKHFEELQRLRLLTYVQPDPNRETYPCSLPCENACPMDVVEMAGKQYAICPQNNEVDPIPLDEDALEQYEFSIERLLERIRVANGFGGTLQKIDQELFYLGYTTYRGSRVGFVFGFICVRKSVLELTGLKRLCVDDDFLVVFSPVSVIEDVSIRRELGRERVVQTSFGLSLNFQTYQLSLEKLLSGVIAQRATETKSKSKKRGCPKKYTEQFLRKVKTSFEQNYQETEHKQQSWQLAAEEHGLTSSKAAETACRRYLTKQNKKQN